MRKRSKQIGSIKLDNYDMTIFSNIYFIDKDKLSIEYYYDSKGLLIEAKVQLYKSKKNK